ncbi:hypothetical protein OAV85_00200 [Candidatus Nanopelagicales bacterium]|jgi:chromosome segregation ATPase|nr:hypothetical protein [Candidatus Nanopelagicales bacterium]
MSAAVTEDPGGSVTPAEILERLKARISELENQLTQAKHELSDRRRLQDLSPEELSLVAVGAAGEIIKAARAQAADVRSDAERLQTQVREKAQAALAAAQERANRLTSDAEEASAATKAKAQATAEEILERVRSEADAITSSARSEAEAIREQAKQESDGLVQEAQTRLQVALRSADQSIATANQEGRQIIEAARAMADSLRDEARSEARAILQQSLDDIAGQENDMTSLLHEAGSMRAAIASALDTIRSAADTAAAETARAEASNRTYLASMAQVRSDLQRRLGPSSSPSSD